MLYISLFSWSVVAGYKYKLYIVFVIGRRWCVPVLVPIPSECASEMRPVRGLLSARGRDLPLKLVCSSEDSRLSVDPDECGPSPADPPQDTSGSVQRIIHRYSQELHASLTHAGKH